jgi:hypothetical protein
MKSGFCPSLDEARDSGQATLVNPTTKPAPISHGIAGASATARGHRLMPAAGFDQTPPIHHVAQWQQQQHTKRITTLCHH